MVENAVSIVLTILLLMATGYFATMFGLIKKESAAFMSKLVVTVALPATMINNMTGYFTREQLLGAGIALLVPFLTVGAGLIVGWSLAYLLRITPSRRGVFVAMFAFSNTVFIGLPINQALFGDVASSYALFYFAGNTCLFWLIGVGGIKKDAHPEMKMFSSDVLKRLFSPSLVSFIIGLLLVLIGIQLPDFLSKGFKYVSSLCTPLSLIYMGHVICSNGILNIRLGKDGWPVLLARFVICPAIAYGLVRLMGVQGTMGMVFVTQASMPVMSQIPILTGAYGADAGYATSVATVTTILCIVMLPVYSWLFGFIF